MDSIVPRKLGRASWYMAVLWLIGFVWSMVVFAVPALWEAPAVAGVSKHPPISAVMLPLYAVLITLLAGRYMRVAGGGAPEGRRLGIFFAATNLALDLLVYVGLFRAQDYFAYASIWLGYGLLLGIPWAVAASRPKARAIKGMSAGNTIA